jgi:hypothetical protein
MIMTELDAVTWRKSSYSANGGTCVEVGSQRSAVLVRDTKDRDGGALAFPGASWRTFLGQLAAGQAH